MFKTPLFNFRAFFLLVRLINYNGVVNLSRTMAGNRALVKRVLPYLKNSVTIYDLKVSLTSSYVDRTEEKQRKLETFQQFFRFIEITLVSHGVPEYLFD